MVNSLQNKNRTDLLIITVKTSKETVDQFDFVLFIFLTEFILPGKLFREIKKSSARLKLKTMLKIILKTYRKTPYLRPRINRTF